MSGIAGIFHLDGRPADPALLHRMTEAMAHRGPDGAGHWTDGPVALGHRMLWTTPEALQEKQPLTDELGDLCLTLDGRVDNREELRRALEAGGLHLRTATDAELVLRAYERWGEECPAHIIGDFAFALWDRRRRQLFCARDPLGVKPFYYHLDGHTFRFASEMQPFFQDAAVTRRPNLRLIGLYLLERYDDAEPTLYEGILRLPPSSSLVVRDGGLRQHRYWEADPARAVRYAGAAEYAGHFRDLFREAVRCRLRSPRPVGALLSGGLDSSSVVCTAREILGGEPDVAPGLEAYTIVFDTLPCDERGYVADIARERGVAVHLIPHEAQDPSYLALARAPRDPDALYAPTNLMLQPAYARMQARGAAVVLDGFGGDELLAPGLAHLTDLALAGDLRGLARQLRAAAEASAIPARSLFVHHCLAPLVPPAWKARLRALLRAPAPAPSLLRADFLRAQGLDAGAGAPRRSRRWPTHAQQEIHDALFADWSATVARGMCERLAARFSLEPRSPFLDRRLVEFMLAIPPAARYGLAPKAILREAMAGVLPESIRHRPDKSVLSAVIEWEFRRRQPGELRRLLERSALAALGVVDGRRLGQLLVRCAGDQGDDALMAVELVVGLEIWYRSTVSAAGASPLPGKEEKRA